MCTITLPSRASAWACASVRPFTSASRFAVSLYLSRSARFLGEEMMAMYQSQPARGLAHLHQLELSVACASFWK